MRSRNARAVVAFVLMLSFVALSLSACSKQQTGTQAVKEVRVGLVLPLTGTQAAIGELCRRGHDLALEEWNEKGGIKSLGGAKLVYVVGDAQSDVQTARSETERLIVKEKVVAVTGAY
ncbi:MAG TPA: ABC transporter substrate-binding protein, partial [Firmicutes bacterium]|nr:ABC transporter substrate-binding protein [Bacillota bacterium]